MYQIVVGVDGSPASELALAWAIEAARRRDGAVKAVQAWQLIVAGDAYGYGMVDPLVLEEVARSVLDESVDRADTTGLATPVERALVLGAAASALIEAAKDADLVVVGSRGRGGFAGLLLGSVSRRLVQHAPRPVVVLPAAWGRPPRRRIVVGVDGSDGARSALVWALDWAELTASEIDVVLAFDSELAWIDVGSDYEARWMEQANEKAKSEVQRIVDQAATGKTGVTMHPVVANGAPARVLLDRAEDADLLVVGTRGRGGFAGLVLGSVSQRCAEHSPCPVAVVPVTT